MSWASRIRNQVEREWKCFGHYGYGCGAAFREAAAASKRSLSELAEYGPCNPARKICPQAELCQKASAKRADEAHPAAAEVARRMREVEAEEFLEEGTWVRLAQAALREKLPGKYLLGLPNGRSRLLTHYEAEFYANLEAGAEGRRLTGGEEEKS